MKRYDEEFVMEKYDTETIRKAEEVFKWLLASAWFEIGGINKDILKDKSYNENKIFIEI
jgi:hypothetical protein